MPFLRLTTFGIIWVCSLLAMHAMTPSMPQQGNFAVTLAESQMIPIAIVENGQKQSEITIKPSSFNFKKSGLTSIVIWKKKLEYSLFSDSSATKISGEIKKIKLDKFDPRTSGTHTLPVIVKLKTKGNSRLWYIVYNTGDGTGVPHQDSVIENSNSCQLEKNSDGSYFFKFSESLRPGKYSIVFPGLSGIGVCWDFDVE